MKREARTIKIDRRLTGANIIDEPLQQVSFRMWCLNSLYCVVRCISFEIIFVIYVICWKFIIMLFLDSVLKDAAYL